MRRLAGRTDDPTIKVLIAALADPHPYVRGAAAGVLGTVVEAPIRARILREASGWKDPRAREAILDAFAAWADADGRTGCLKALADPVPAVRAHAAYRLVDDPDPVAGEALRLAATTDADGSVRATALDALVARKRTRGAVPVDAPLESAGRDRDPRVRLSALEGSVAAGGEAAAVAVLAGLDDAVWSNRLAAAELAGAVRDRRMLAPLVSRLTDARERVVQAASRSLVKLTGIPFDADPGRWKAWLETDGQPFDPAAVEPRKAAGFDPGGRTVAPVKFLDLTVPSTHVTFVLDASGSMAEPVLGGGTRWDRVRVEMDRVLAALGTSAEGNVIVFSDKADPVFPKAVRFSASARAEVRDRLAARLPRGRTALYDGIALALADPEVDSVVVLSDGVPSTGERFTKTDVREGIRRANRWRKARIDVIAVGADDVAERWRSLLEDVAEESGGKFLAK